MRAWRGLWEGRCGGRFWSEACMIDWVTVYDGEGLDVLLLLSG